MYVYKYIYIYIYVYKYISIYIEYSIAKLSDNTTYPSYSNSYRLQVLM